MLNSPLALPVLLLSILGYTGFMLWFFLKLLRGFKRKELAHQRQMLESRFQAEKNLYEARQEIQEETFKQISRELHDNVGQTFSLAKLGLANLEEMDSMAELKAAVLEISDILGKGISDLRDISRSLKAELVKATGLAKAIETQVGFLERTGHYQIVFDAAPELVATDPATEVIFYRILQESLNNIIRHAKATEIRIQLSNVGSKLRLRVQDNGLGFEPAQSVDTQAEQGGLNNMTTRARSIGADLSVESYPHQGTCITITSK